MRRPRKRRQTVKPRVRFPTRYLTVTRRHLPPLVVFLITAVTLWFFFLSGFATIQKIDCQTDGKACDPQTEAELGRLTSTPILTLKKKEIEHRILNSSPAIDTVEITPHFPQTIEVRITLRQAAVVLRVPGTQTMLVSDWDGLIIRGTQDQDRSLPQIVSASIRDIGIGQQINDTATHTAIVLAGVMTQYFLPFEVITVDRDIRVTLDEDTVAVFSHNADPQRKVPSLQRILSDVTMNTKPTLIDLRHEKPVVRFE